jgi:hypothetical protein
MTRDLSVSLQVPRAYTGNERFRPVFARPKLIEPGARGQGRDYGVFFFLTSTLLPMTPPRMPPAAAPMMPPLILSLLVAAPMIAPAAAPIVASRLVFFWTVVVVGAGAGVEVPTEPFEEDDVVRRGAEAVDREELLARGADAAGAGEAFPRSTAEMLSSDRCELA